MKAGVTINRPPRDGVMAFGALTDGNPSNSCKRAPRCRPEPWKSMANTGKW